MKKIIRPGGTMENVRGFPVSLQDTISFCDAPDTLCLANFPLSLWDEKCRRRREESLIKNPKAELK